MSSNISSQLQQAKRDYELALDNATLKQSKIAVLQNELMAITANTNTRSSTQASDVEKARKKMDEEQSELLKIQAKLEDIQKDFTKAQSSATQAREEYTKLELRQRTGLERDLQEQDKKRRSLETEIKREETTRKSWAIKAENARRDMEIWQRRMIEESSRQFTSTTNSRQSANDNRPPSVRRLVA